MHRVHQYIILRHCNVKCIFGFMGPGDFFVCVRSSCLFMVSYTELVHINNTSNRLPLPINCNCPCEHYCIKIFDLYLTIPTRLVVGSVYGCAIQPILLFW